MCTEREVVRESMAAAAPSQRDVAAMELPAATVLEKIPENSRPLGSFRTTYRTPSKPAMRSSSSSSSTPDSAVKRVPSPGPRERPRASAPSPAAAPLVAVKSSSVSDTTGSLSSSVPGQFAKFSSLMNQLARPSSQSAASTAAFPNARTRLPQVPAPSSGPSSSSSSASDNAKPRLSASTEATRAAAAATSSLLSSSVSRPSSPSRNHGIVKAASSNSNKPVVAPRLPSPSRIYNSQASVSSPSVVARPSSPSLSRPSSQTSAAAAAAASSSRPSTPPRVSAPPKARSSTPTRTNGTPSPWTSSRTAAQSSSAADASGVAHFHSITSAASRPSSPSRVAKQRNLITTQPSPAASSPVATFSQCPSSSSSSSSSALRVPPISTVATHAADSLSQQPSVTKSPKPNSSSCSNLTSRSAIAKPPSSSSSSPVATTSTANRPLTPTRSLTKASTKAPVPSSSTLAHQSNPPSSFSSLSFANLKTVPSAALTTQNHIARCSFSPSESPRGVTGSGEYCSNVPDTSKSSSSGLNMATTRKALLEFQAQQQQQTAGSKHSQAPCKTSARVVPEGLPVSPTSYNVKKRCGWITSQSESALIAYHDEEWGIPVYDEKLLFELIVLAGAQAELSLSSILALRDDFRDAFAGFDPAVVAKFNEKKIATLIANPRIRIPEAKIRGAIDNAKRVLEIAEECGSLTNFLWSFVNYKPMVSHYKLSKQVPVKTPKSEALSNELVRRGFRYVGPTTMYVLMQAAGLANDHLATCFRYHECATTHDLPPLTGNLCKEIQPEKERSWSSEVVADDNLLTSFSSRSMSSKTGPPAFDPGAWLYLPALDASSRLSSGSPCEPLWAELPMIEEAFEDEIERLNT